MAAYLETALEDGDPTLVAAALGDIARTMQNATKRPRISVDLDPAIRRGLRLAAAKRAVSNRQYITDALRERLRDDLGEYDEPLTALTATGDPVLATLWDNENDAAYDRL